MTSIYPRRSLAARSSRQGSLLAPWRLCESYSFSQSVSFSPRRKDARVAGIARSRERPIGRRAVAAMSQLPLDGVEEGKLGQFLSAAEFLELLPFLVAELAVSELRQALLHFR